MNPSETSFDTEFDMSELDRLAADLAGDEFIETVTPSTEDAEVLEEVAPAKPTKKAKAKVVKAKEPKAPKEPKVAKTKKAEVAAETSEEGEAAPKAKKSGPKATKTGSTAAAKEPKATKPAREAARDTLGEEAYNAIVAVIADPKIAKKVVDKAENLLDAAAGRRNLSVYTRIAIDALTKDGAFTSGDLVKLLESRQYSPGTARAQAQQMMALLPLAGIAAREKSALTLVEASPVLAVLKKAA